MTNHQINQLTKILKQNKVTEVCAVLAGQDSGFSYIIQDLSEANPVHAFFSKEGQLTAETYKTETIHGAFLKSGKISELIAFLQIPETNPAR